VWFCGCEMWQEKYSRELTVYVRAEFGQRMRDMCMLEQIFGRATSEYELVFNPCLVLFYISVLCCCSSHLSV